MPSQKTIIALAGKAGAGKDTILNYLCDNYDVHPIVSCTTRPPREGEIDGVNYHFLTNEQFAEKVLNFDMLEACEFNNWFYGTDYNSLSDEKVNVGVFNPSGIEQLMENPDIKVIPFLVDASDKTRLMRQLCREDNPNVDEIIRRFGTDKQDFDVLFAEEIEDYGIISNENGTFPYNVAVLAHRLNLAEIK